MSPLRSALLLSAAFCGLVSSSQAQQNNAADRLLSARALYYTPTTAGLTSFQCSVGFDWKEFLTSASGKEILDDNPMLVYLNATKLSVFDQLRRSGSLQWTNEAKIPDGLDASIAQMRTGMITMFGGFFQSWNAYMNGSMVPAPDSKMIVAPDGPGVQLHSKADGYDVTEKFDKNMLLTVAHVITSDADIEAYPTYIDTPDGRIISIIHSLYHQPATAPAMEINVATLYTKVDGFQLPSDLKYEVKNVAAFHFTLTGCEVNKASSSTAKP